MSDNPKNPIPVLVACHWLSLLGVALVTIAGFSWLFVLSIQLSGHTNNHVLSRGTVTARITYLSAEPQSAARAQLIIGEYPASEDLARRGGAAETQ